MRELLLAVCWSWNSFFSEEGYAGVTGGTREIMQSVFSTISTVLWVALGIVGAVGAVYAIFLGVQLARAEEQGKRDDAKKHLITVFIAIGVTVALILVFNTFMPALITAFVKSDTMKIDDDKKSLLQPVLSLVKARLL